MYHIIKASRAYEGFPYSGPSSNLIPLEFEHLEDAIAKVKELNKKNFVGWKIYDVDTKVEVLMNMLSNEIQDATSEITLMLYPLYVKNALDEKVDIELSPPVYRGLFLDYLNSDINLNAVNYAVTKHLLDKSQDCEYQNSCCDCVHYQFEFANPKADDDAIVFVCDAMNLVMPGVMISCSLYEKKTGQLNNDH